MLATTASAFSVPAAIGLQLVLLILAAVDARRAPVPSVRRVVEGTQVLNGILDVRLHVSAGDARMRVTDDIGPGLERLPLQDLAPDEAGDGPGEEVGEASGEDDVGGSGDGIVDAYGGGVVDGSREDGAEVDPGVPGVVGYRLGLRRRGDLRLGSIHVRTLGPLGLGWRRTTFHTADVVRVLPGVEELRRERMPGLRPSLAAVGLRRTRRRGEGLEFESLREYRQGDDPRIVDWKASARRTELVVRNYQVERNQTVVLAIDAGRLMREWIGDRERLDYALTAAFLVAERARLYGDRVGVIVFDEEVRTLIPAGRVRLSELADTFATVESRLVEPNYPVAFATLKRAFRKRALVLMLSDVIDLSASRALVDGLVGAVARHLPVVVALRNPDVEAVASGKSTVPAGAPVEGVGASAVRARSAVGGASPYQRAAAESVLDARATALRTMRRAGVHTVDVLPGDAGLASLDKYTEIKKRGLL